ncbi:hypothetical protein DRN58_09560, partial [Thermococci archaeon]
MKDREKILKAFNYLEKTKNKSSKEQFLKDCKILGEYILEAYKEDELTKIETAIFLEKIKEMTGIKEVTSPAGDLSEIFSQTADAFIGFSKDFYIELKKGIKDLRIF